MTSTKQFVWCGNERCEQRDNSGAITRQFFSGGEIISGSSYFFNLDHLGSVREMSNSAGTIVWQQSFDPYGVPTTVVSMTPADFGYAGYYTHGRSQLSLTVYRQYDFSFGRWLNRDPLEEASGTNLYAYVQNDPIAGRDPLGLIWPDYYGNWGGPHYTNRSTEWAETDNFPNYGDPGFVPPKDKRDQSYYNHDVCLHNCARIEDCRNRRNCRQNCDQRLAGDLMGLPPEYFLRDPKIPLEIALFGTIGPNNNGEGYNPDAIPYSAHNFFPH